LSTVATANRLARTEQNFTQCSAVDKKQQAKEEVNGK